MKKNIIMKGILLLIILTILSIIFAGCSPIIIIPTPTTGTVYISIANDSYWYDIYVDGVFQGQTDGAGNYTLTNVPIGNHSFEAYDTSWWNYYGSKWQYIHSGSNTVTIWVY
jgi:hypothetical protein